MNKINNEILFKNKDEAKNLLEYSRNRIDEIDNQLIDLISKRNSLAKDIVYSKIFLDMDIYDKNRENIIYDKVSKLAIDKNIDKNILIQIMNLLIDLSKIQQNKILRKRKNGKY